MHKTFDGVDSGKDDPMYNRSPILVADGLFAKNKTRVLFAEHSATIDADIRAFVLEKILQYEG